MEKKIGMTSLYDDKGNNLACAVIQAGPYVVTQIKYIEKDGYNAIQVGFDNKKERLITKSELGHFKNSKQSPKSKLMEFSNYENELKVGDVLSADLFVEGEYVDVTGVSKGKGFQGVGRKDMVLQGLDNLLMVNITGCRAQLEQHHILQEFSKE